MLMNPVLFAMISNDAFNSGTYGLEGMRFVNTIEYLKEYFDYLASIKEPVSAEYLQLAKDSEYLASIENEILKHFIGAQKLLSAGQLAQAIYNDLIQLPLGSRLLLPGGWSTHSVGHAMVYQFTRTEQGYTFTVFNSGSGLEYHAKKSRSDKELLNPTKVWAFPVPKTGSAKVELKQFFERLLQAKFPVAGDPKNKPRSAQMLYEDLFPSISYIQGVELDANEGFPEYAYTGGQLSGSCPQRCLHQMYKVNSISSQAYQQFICKFKLHALAEYTKLCGNGTLPYTPAVKNQIDWAIDNNLKIINIPGIFSPAEVHGYLVELSRLRKTMNDTPFLQKNPAPIEDSKSPAFTLTDEPLLFSELTEPPASPYNDELQEFAMDFDKQDNMLDKLKLYIDQIKKINDPVVQYYYLEKLILTLPINTRTESLFAKGFYRSLDSSQDYQIFQDHLSDIQDLLIQIRESWLNGAHIPQLSCMVLCVLSLQIDAYQMVTMKANLPSFMPFSASIMETLVGNHRRDPFVATNHPLFDQRYTELFVRFLHQPNPGNEAFYQYLNNLLQTESNLSGELKARYQESYGKASNRLHEDIRSFGLEAVFMLTAPQPLEPYFMPLAAKMDTHIQYESRLRRAVNPFFKQQLSAVNPLRISISGGFFCVHTPMYPNYITFQPLSLALLKDKYTLTNASPARFALEADVSEYGTNVAKIRVKTANGIQLKPAKNSADNSVTQQNIKDRDFEHLRANPFLQIPLTLDYFTRHIADLAGISNQRYVEANLFQPGLLRSAMRQDGFFAQLDRFLEKGLRFFSHNGQYTRDSLLFVRLDFLVSRYLALMGKIEGCVRLKALQDELTTQLSLLGDLEVIYVLQQYVFLTSMARQELGESSNEFFAQAFDAYFYLIEHTNPLILEDSAHRAAFESAVVCYKFLVGQKPEIELQKIVKNTLHKRNYPVATPLQGEFPVYRLMGRGGATLVEVDVLQGKFFEKRLARSGIPLALKNHPLMKQHNLHEVSTGLANPQNTHMVLDVGGVETHIDYPENNLTIRQYWTINGHSSLYELQALTADHLAQKANKRIRPVTADLPKILTDGAMNYWSNMAFECNGILVKNGASCGVPLYSIEKNKIKVLDSKCMDTAYQLGPLKKEWFAMLQFFEIADFILPHHAADHSLIYLPRYGLDFKVDHQSQIMTLQQTGEQVISCPPIIHRAVSTVVLADHKAGLSCLVPVGRFYAVDENDVEPSVYYPVAHDKNTIVPACLDEYWRSHPVLDKPQWYYQNSRAYVRYQLKNGAPIADSAADALYLAYIYLATHQPEKAWDSLDECTTRFGGLKGDIWELCYISWIYLDLPHVLPNTDQTETLKAKTQKNTPPYIACQLKALSLVADYLFEDRQFYLKRPDIKDNTANSLYALLQHQCLDNFLTTLAESIYKLFVSLQKMGRHLEHRYQLSKTERKRLLDFYHLDEELPLGALGYEWMKLSREALHEERDFLFARKLPLNALEPRLEQIDRHLRELQPVRALSTALELVSIDLTLPTRCSIKCNSLQRTTVNHVGSWQNKVLEKFTPEDQIDAAMNELSSGISEDKFLLNIPMYLYVAVYSNKEYAKILLAFCSQTLLAKRHVALEKQDSNLPMLCNILYRIMHNVPEFKKFIAEVPVVLFDDMVKIVSCYKVAPLQVYQAQDRYQHILAAVPDAHNLPRDLVIYQPVLIAKNTHKSLLEQIGLSDGLIPQQQKSLKKFLKAYQILDEEHEKSLAVLGATLTPDLDKTFAIEEEAGRRQLLLMKQKNKLAQDFNQNLPLSLVLQSAAFAAGTVNEGTENTLWVKALNLANQGPDAVEQARSWALEKESRVRASLVKADLVSLYVRADMALSSAKTGLNSENLQQLHDLIHNALVEGIKHQILTKIATTLYAMPLTPTNVSAVVGILDLLARSEIPALDEPALVILQYEEGLILNPRQVSALKELLGVNSSPKRFNELVEKIIMGGGKSKVILPALGEQKATGDNLVVVVVPHTLLATNHQDLNQISQRLFGKRAYRFEFNRDSKCTPKRLEQLYQYFIEIMTSKGYLVTTTEAMQSLELKYLELLFLNDKDNESWQKQVYWCDKITNLLRFHADCIIDEVHQGLSIKKRLNYTLGASESLRSVLAKHASALFRMIDLGLIRNAPEFSDDYDWTPFKKELIARLVHDTNSPLHLFVTGAVQKYGAAVKEELIAYLGNIGKMVHQAIAYADDEDKLALAFFKQQINVLLPQTLSRRLGEHYGPSKRFYLSTIERTQALPYAANNIANERSRFGNVLESINYTIQMMLLNGISEALLIEHIIQWQTLARQELFQNLDLKHLDDTPTARGFFLLAEGLGFTLSQVNVKNAAQMRVMHNYFQHNQALIFDVLQEQTLEQIHADHEVLPSNSFSHVDQYRSVQGLSGTPANYTTYHQRLRYNKTASLGSDGYLLAVINDKNTPLSHLDYHNVPQFIKGVLAQSTSSERTRALIDVSASFRGVSNMIVAQEIARALRNQSIKHVLYFNDEQVLCALSIDKPDCPIVLASSDEVEIYRLLGSRPHERFTYYDQAHTLGTDIQQDSTAHALVTVDEKTSLQAFMQGSLRMRALCSGQQTMEIIAPTKLKDLTRTDLLKHFALAEQHALIKENLSAAKMQMHNFMRRQCLSYIQDLPVDLLSNKVKLAQDFKPFFIETLNEDLYGLYGGMQKTQATADILGNYKQQLMELWAKCVAETGYIEAEMQMMSQALQEIISNAIPHCAVKYDEIDSLLSTEVECQKYTQIETLAQKECFSPDLIAAPHKTWGTLELAHIHNSNQRMECISVTLNDLCLTDIFSNYLRASRNYAETYAGQKKYLDVFLKPVFLIWYHIHNEELRAMIVTPQESVELSKLIHNSKLPASWLATTQDTVLAGQIPRNMLNNTSYLILREQVRFFNGELADLLNQKTPPQWLRATHLPVFQKLLPYRPESALPFQQLKIALTQSNLEGFVYIAHHPFEDLSQCNWRKLLPKTQPAQAALYRRLAEAFVHMNRALPTANLSIQKLQQLFNLPLNSLDYVKEHLNHLLTITQIEGKLCNMAASGKSFLNGLSGADRSCLERYMDKSLTDFYPQQDALLLEEEMKGPNNTNNKMNFAVLMALRSVHEVIRGAITTFYLDEALILLATSVTELHQLLKLNSFPNELLRQVAQHDLCDESVVNAILDFPTLSPVLLINVTLKCNTDALVGRLIALPDLSDLPDKAFLNLLEQPCITAERVLRLASLIRSNSAFYTFLLHGMTSDAVRQAVYANPAFSEGEFMLYVVKHRTNISRLEQLLNTLPLMKTTLGKCAAETTNTNMLLMLLMHKTVCKEVVHGVILNKLFSEDLTAAILQVPELDRVLLDKLLTVVYEKYKNAERLQDFQDAQSWDNSLVNICGGFSRINQLGALLDHMKHLQFSRKSNFILLNLFGKDIAPVLPVADMIAGATPKELELCLDEDKTGVLSENSLHNLLKRCVYRPHLERFLERRDLSSIIWHIIVTQIALDEALLLKISKLPLDEKTRDCIYGHPSGSKALREAMADRISSQSIVLLLASNTSVSNEEWLQILQHPRAITAEVLRFFVLSPRIGVEVINAVAVHDKLEEEVLRTLFYCPAFSPALMKLIIARPKFEESVLLYLVRELYECLILENDPKLSVEWENCIVHAFKKLKREQVLPFLRQYPVHAHISFSVLCHFGKDLLPELNFTYMVHGISRQDLDFFINLDVKYTEEQLRLLTQRTLNAVQIDAMLDRRDMTAYIADILFAKPQYSGKMKYWNWMTEAQLLNILDSMRDFSSLSCALTHANVLGEALDRWFERVKASQARDINAVNVEKKSMATIDKLKILICSQVAQFSYENTEVVAFNLYKNLYKEITIYFSAERKPSVVFYEQCRQAISEAEPILSANAEYKQALVELLSMVLNLASSNNSSRADAGFFKKKPRPVHGDYESKCNNGLPAIGH